MSETSTKSLAERIAEAAAREIVKKLYPCLDVCESEREVEEWLQSAISRHYLSLAEAAEIEDGETGWRWLCPTCGAIGEQIEKPTFSRCLPCDREHRLGVPWPAELVIVKVKPRAGKP